MRARPAFPPRSLQRNPPNYSASQSIAIPLHSPSLFRFTVHHAPPALPSFVPPSPRFTVHPRCRSLQSSLQAISTLHNPSRFVRRSRLAPAELPPSYFQRFTVDPRSSDASVSLPPAEIPPKYFQTISRLFPRFPLRPCSCLPSLFSSFPLSFLPSFLPSLLVRLFCLAPLAAKEAKREPKHLRCFCEKNPTPSAINCR